MPRIASLGRRPLGRSLLLRVALVLISLACVWVQPFYGTPIALILVILLHFYYPGYLLGRVLGVGQPGHPFARFAWWLAAAFGLTITLGGFARLLAVPVSVYLLVLHGVMFVLALLPARAGQGEEAPAPRPAPVYILLVLLSCVVVVYVGVERSRVRFNGYEDQTVFVELVDWLSREPDDPTIDSRMIGLPAGATRWDFDGWSYNQAAWVRVSGVSASQLLWFDLTPLFVWTVPLAVFGLAYTLTRRESAAAWSVIALTVVGLMTVDSLVTYNSTLVYGQFSLFQLNSLRTFATALLSPLALMAALAYIRRPGWALLFLTLLIGIAVGMAHARPTMTFIYSMGATAAVWWLARPSKMRVLQTAALAFVLLLVLVLPSIQRRAPVPIVTSAPPVGSAVEIAPSEEADMSGEAAPDVSADPPQEASVQPAGDPRGDLLILQDLPLVGDSFIVQPRSVFYHPAIVVAVVLGLIAIYGWRRSLAAAYIAASTVATLIFLFVPGITPVMTALTSPTVIASLIFAVPVPLILGFSVDAGLRRLGRTGRGAVAVRWGAAVGAVVLIAALLFEPFPIPASARDQIRASNVMQAERAMRDSDAVLVATLRRLLPDTTRSVVVTPNRVANFVSEDVPYAFVTGGREQGNAAYDGNTRFLAGGRQRAPWLDRRDLEFLREWGVTHIVLDADATRVPQLTLDPRFRLLAQPAGYVIFEVLDPTTQPTDDLFAEMNRIYAANVNERWSPSGFALDRPGNADLWRDVIDRWQALPVSDVQRLGLAFALTLAGDDSAAVSYWQALAQEHPDVAYYVPALAATQAVVAGPDTARQTLLDALAADNPTTRVLAARTLLTDAYFYLLNGEDLDRVLAVTETDAAAWDQLAVYDQADAIRRRIVLMLSRERWDAAERWSQTLAERELDPRDFVTRASIALVQGDVERALAILEPTADPDLVAANRYTHPDRWMTNSAQHLLLALRAELATRAGNPQAAQSFYAQMLQTGVSNDVARYFAADDAARRAALDELTASSGEAVPVPISPLAIADTGRLFILDPAVRQTPDGDFLVEVTFGNLHEQPFPVREWRLQLISPDATIFYADISQPAIFFAGALSRSTFHVELADDIPSDTQALVVIKALYDNRVELSVVYLPVTLNPTN